MKRPSTESWTPLIVRPSNTFDSSHSWRFFRCHRSEIAEYQRFETAPTVARKRMYSPVLLSRGSS